ncbi:hypothetical protein D3C87_1500260 [compost metagenome]
MAAHRVPGREDAVAVMAEGIALPVQPRHALHHLPHDGFHGDRRAQRVVDDRHRHAAPGQHAGYEAMVALVERPEVAAVDEHQQRRTGAGGHPRGGEVVEALVVGMGRRRIAIGQVLEVRRRGGTHQRRIGGPAGHVRGVVRHAGAVVVGVRVERGILGWQLGKAGQGRLV